MTDAQQARALAIEFLRSIEPAGCPFQITEVVEHSFGWVFYYNSEEYVRTGNFLSTLAGNGPVVVHRGSGEVSVFRTSESVAPQIERLEREWTTVRENHTERSDRTERPPE